MTHMDKATNAQMRNTYSEAFAETLRSERELRGLSKQDVATAAKIPATTYERLESGSRVITSAHLGVLAEALGMTLMEFVRRAEVRVAAAQEAEAEGKNLVKRKRA